MYRSIKHLNFIRKQPCIISDQLDSQACHIRILSDAGVGLKPSDFAIPMTYYYHRMSHGIDLLSNKKFYSKWTRKIHSWINIERKKVFKKFNINPYDFAIFYAKNSPCKKITREHLEYLNERKSIYERLYKNR